MVQTPTCIVAYLAGVVSGASASDTPFAENIFGVWEPKKGVPTKSILGPIAYDFLASGPGLLRTGFTALRDHRTGDVWFTLLDGQVWRTSGVQTQYCFGEEVLAEQSPFQVKEVTETSVNICWRDGDRGMPTHAKGCTGCDCARILLNLTAPDTLKFTFWMSPPVIHADLVFTRTGAPPSFSMAIQSTLSFPYQQCRMVDHYGPNIPGEPNLRNQTFGSRNGCGLLPQRVAESLMKNDDVPSELRDSLRNGQPASDSRGVCRQLNGLNFKIDKFTGWGGKAMGVSDVRFQYVPPSGRCEPCDVSYSVSAKTADDEYIGVGFKGQSWEGKDPFPPEIDRPCYFGMCVDSYDNFTSDRIAVGYTTNGGCVREMTTDKVIGAPSDVSYKILKHTAVERVGDRTVLRFTLSQHWPTAHFDGIFRVMWAIGKVSNGSSACNAQLGYHDNHRGVAPVKWLLELGSTGCEYNGYEMDGTKRIVV